MSTNTHGMERAPLGNIFYPGVIYGTKSISNKNICCVAMVVAMVVVVDGKWLEMRKQY